MLGADYLKSSTGSRSLIHILDSGAGSGKPTVQHDLVATFKQSFQALSGHVHLAGNTEQVLHLIAKILAVHKARRIALAGLSQDLHAGIDGVCAAQSIEILCPPFDAASAHRQIDTAEVGITAALFAIAETSTIAELATTDDIRMVSSLPRTHISIVRVSTLVSSLHDAAPLVREAFKASPAHCVVSFISGPSRTGDIELKLTLGVHGPETVHAILLDDAETVS